MGDIFTKWNEGELDSFLIEITADILETNRSYHWHTIRRCARYSWQKGTGKWTSVNALDMGTLLQPSPKPSLLGASLR